MSRVESFQREFITFEDKRRAAGSLSPTRVVDQENPVTSVTSIDTRRTGRVKSLAGSFACLRRLDLAVSGRRVRYQ